MRRCGVLVAFVLVAGMIMTPASPAFATTACGVLLTNVASATYRLQADPASTSGTVEYNVTVNVLVETPDIAINKVGNPTLMAPGGTVTFCVSFLNLSTCASAVNVVVQDAIPTNMVFMGALFTNDPANASIVTSWSMDAGATWNPGYPGVGFTPRTLRWAVDLMGMGTSGYICYRASVQ